MRKHSEITVLLHRSKLGRVNPVHAAMSTPTIFHKVLKKSRYVTCHVHIWNRHRRFIRMNTNMLVFGPVGFEIACPILKKEMFFPLDFF